MTQKAEKYERCAANGCRRKPLPGYRYCKKCGAARVLAQRKRLGQVPRSRTNGGRASVYLPEEMR